MNTKTNLNKLQSIEDLLTQMACGEHQNLKVFMNRYKCSNRKLPQDYLYVDSKKFGKVRVCSLDYLNNAVTIDFSDCQTCIDGTLCIDINAKPDFMLVNWEDVVSMVREDQQTCRGRDDMLEFDF